MTRIHALLGLAALLLGAPGVLAQTREPASAPAPAATSATPAGAVAATTNSATASAPATMAAAEPVASQPATDEAAEQPAISEELLKTARDSSVIISVTFRKDTSEEASESETDPEEYYFQYLLDRKMTLDVPGVVIRPGEVLIPDLRLEDRFVQSIEARTLDGVSAPAKLSAVMTHCDGEVLTLEGPSADKFTPLKFTPLDKITLATTLQDLSVMRQDDQWCLVQQDLQPTVSLTDPSRILLYGMPGTPSRRYRQAYTEGPSIIANSNGEPVGVACGAGIDSQQLYGCWLGNSVLECPRIPVAALESGRKSMRERLRKSIHEVAIQFRQGGSGEESEPPSGTQRPGGYSLDSLAGREVTLYGVAISDTRIFVPVALDRRIAALIERTDVKLGPLTRMPARFVGAYKEFGGFLVEVTRGKLPGGAAEMTDTVPPRCTPFWTGTARKRYADKYLDLDYSRLLGRTRGYGNRYHWQATRTLRPGQLLYDFQGRLFGLVMKQRMEDEEQKEAMGRSGGPSGSPEDQYCIFTMAEIRDQLAAPQKNFDDQIVVKGRLDARRRPWFGVEYVTLTAEVAEFMKVSKPTKDGSVGLLVNTVYEGSPADKAGIQVGDILLSLTVAGKGEPLEFKGRNAQPGEYDTSGEAYANEDEGPAEDEGPPEKTWKSRNNFLTNLLDAIGTGKQVSIRYYRPADNGTGEEKLATFRIELAPPDFDSARRWKNEKVGLTVKDLTYEIRKALALPGEAPGVVVAKVEPGSPAAEARVWPNEVITHLDGQPLTGAWQMRKLVAEAKAAGKSKVRLTVLRLGKSRFADLKIDVYNAGDDEGLDEEEASGATPSGGAQTQSAGGARGGATPAAGPSAGATTP